MSVVDAAKFLLLSIGAFDMGVALVVAVRYMRKWNGDRSRLLPLHVWVVATSYMLLLGLATTSRVENLGDPFNRWAVYGIAVVLGLVAMVVIARVPQAPKPLTDVR